MFHDWSPTQDPRHQAMSAMLSLAVNVVREPHSLDDNCFMLDGMIRLRPEDEVGQAGIAGFLVAFRLVLDAHLAAR